MVDENRPGYMTVSPDAMRQALDAIEAEKRLAEGVDPQSPEYHRIMASIAAINREGNADALTLLDRFMEAYFDNKSMADCCDERIADLRARKEDHKARAERCLGNSFTLLVASGRGLLQHAAYTLSKRRVKPKIVGDVRVETVPSSCVRTVTKKEVDMDKLYKLLMSGRTVPGIELAPEIEVPQVRVARKKASSAEQADDGDDD